MRRDSALAILREHEAELKARGVAGLRLFGSVARDEATEESDVDVLADFDSRESLLHVGGLQQDLSRWLGVHVDLSTEPWLKPRVRERVLKEQVVAF